MTPEIENERWELPGPLRLTPERLEEVEAEQRKLAARAQSPFANLSPAEHERATAARVASEHKANLELLDFLILKGEGLKRPSRKERGGLRVAKDARPAVAAQLAAAYAVVGRYDLAAEVEPDEGQRAEYLKIWGAVWRKDEAWCDCPPPLAGGTHSFVRQNIFSAKHQREMPLLRCAVCGCMNVAPLPAALAEQRRHRAAAQALVGGMKPDEAKRVLTAHKHTAEALLK